MNRPVFKCAGLWLHIILASSITFLLLPPLPRLFTLYLPSLCVPLCLWLASSLKPHYFLVCFKVLASLFVMLTVTVVLHLSISSFWLMFSLFTDILSSTWSDSGLFYSLLFLFLFVPIQHIILPHSVSCLAFGTSECTKNIFLSGAFLWLRVLYRVLLLKYV